MRCSTCGRDNEREAIFCVYCGIRIETQPNYTPVQPAATGATIDLGRKAAKVEEPKPQPQVWKQPPLPQTPVAPPKQTQQTTCNTSFNWMPLLIFFVVMMIISKGFVFWWLPFVFFSIWSNNNRSRHKHWKRRHRHRW